MHLCLSTQTVLTFFKMYKKYVVFIIAVLVIEVRGDCDGYFECFNDFFANFFAHNNTGIEHINPTSNLPEDFVQVKDIKVEDLEKVLSDITSFIHQDINEQLKTESDALFKNVNTNTKVFVKTFNYHTPENINLPGFENINIVTDNKEESSKVVTDSTLPKATPQSTTKNAKKNIIEKQKDLSENEIPNNDDTVSYYDSSEDNATDYPIIDYIDLYKDTTNEENVYDPTESTASVDIRDEIQETLVEYVDEMEKIMSEINNSTTEPPEEIDDAMVGGDPKMFPWIITIFTRKDNASSQFEYYCDGALLTENLAVTAARCLHMNNKVLDIDNILVIIGKTSLLATADGAQMLSVKEIIIHDDFKNVDGRVQNDLALIKFNQETRFHESYQPATVGGDLSTVQRAFTTAWNLKGDMEIVGLDIKENGECNAESPAKYTFCAFYGQDVALCPSYGGIFAGYKSGNWRLYGIRTGDTSDRGLCFDKNVWYTNLYFYYSKWIRSYY